MLIRLLHGLFSHPGRPLGRRLCFPYSGSRSGHSAPETALGLALRFCRSHLSAGIRGPTLVLGIPLLGTSRVRIDDLGGNRDSRWRTGCQTSCLVCAGSQGRVNVDNRVARQKAGNRRDWEKSALQVPTQEQLDRFGYQARAWKVPSTWPFSAMREALESSRSLNCCHEDDLGGAVGRLSGPAGLKASASSRYVKG